MSLTWLLFGFWGCVSIHQVGALTDYDSESERLRKAHRAIEIALHDGYGWTDNTPHRALAIQNLGLMRESSPEVVEGLKTLSFHSNATVRRQAIWALGEIGRELSWNDEAKSLVKSLTKALQKAPSTLDAEYSIDALLKVYISHVHTIEEDLDLLRQLQDYLANTTDPPPNFYVLEQEIQSLPVLLALMGEHLAHQDTQYSPSDLYTSCLALHRYFEQNRSALNDAQYRNVIQETLQKELDILSVNVRSIQLLTLWSLAQSASHGILSEAVAVKLIEQIPHLDSALSPLVHAALWEMLDIQAVRVYFRQFLESNSDAEVHIVLGLLGQRVDLVQRLYHLDVTEGAL